MSPSTSPRRGPYRLLFRLVLRRIDPETAHALSARLLRAAGRLPPPRRAADPVLRTRALGLTFPSPLGVAAGFDKDATTFAGLLALGFGSVEVGTVTARPQAGNPRPRVFRLAADRGLLNAMGFPNDGAEAVAPRLRRRPPGGVIGVNVGRSRAAPAERAAEDYRAAVRRLAPVADYLVLNVSSPNTPGLRDLQAIEPLRALVEEVRDELRGLTRPVPLLVKIAPDLDNEAIDAVADLALELDLDGLVAVNTTVDEGVLDRAAAEAAGRPGGISGAPLKPRALAVLGRLRARTGDRLVLISAGGVEDAADVWERLLAGATLVQSYTGFVYGGPLWPRRVNRELARRLRAAGAASVNDVVGLRARSPAVST